MSSKLAAARMAAWSGVTTTIASAASDRVLINALNESPETGTIVRPNQQKLSAKKLWIAFALEPNGTLQIDHGAEEALLNNGGSLLAVGVKSILGQWESGEAVSIMNNAGKYIARGLCAISSIDLAPLLGLPSKDHPKGSPEEVIHRDDLVLLAPSNS